MGALVGACVCVQVAAVFGVGLVNFVVQTVIISTCLLIVLDPGRLDMCILLLLLLTVLVSCVVWLCVGVAVYGCRVLLFAVVGESVAVCSYGWECCCVPLWVGSLLCAVVDVTVAVCNCGCECCCLPLWMYSLICVFLV